MSNFKRKLAAVVAVMMMFTMFVPAFAAGNIYEAEAKALNDLNLYRGTSATAFVPNLEGQLTREQGLALVVRMFALESAATTAYPTEASALTALAAFKDASSIDKTLVQSVAYAVKAGVTNGLTATTMGPKSNLTGKQYSAFILRQLGQATPADYETTADTFATLAKLDGEEKVDLTGNTAILRDQAVGISYKSLALEYKGLGKTVMAKLLADGVVTQAQIDKSGYKAPVVTVTSTVYSAATAMTEVKVTAADTMVAKFNGTVTTTATFKIEGPTTATPTVTWNAAKTEATLKSAGTFMDGNYTVSVEVTGVTLTTKTATVIVAKNGIQSIEVLSDKLIRTGDTTGEVVIKLKDFYGNDVTETEINNLTITLANATNRVKDAKKGIIEVTTTDNKGDGTATIGWKTTYEQMTTFTAYAKTAVNGTVASASKTLKVSELSRVKSVVLSDVKYPTGSTKLILNKVNAGYMVITAKDQFDREITNENLLDITQENAVNTLVEVYYSIGDSTVKSKMTVTKETNASGVDEMRLNINLSGITGRSNARPVNVQAISKYLGSSSNTVVLDLKLGKEPNKVVLGTPSNVIAATDSNATDGIVVIPMVVTDEDGVQLTAQEIADNAGNGTGTDTSSDFQFTQPATGFDFTVATSGVNIGKLVATTAPAKGNYTLTVQIRNGLTPPSYVALEVRDKAEPRALRMAQEPTSSLLFSGNTKTKYEILDQYGRKMPNNMLTQDWLRVSETDGTFTQTMIKLTNSDTTKLTVSYVNSNATLQGTSTSTSTDLIRVITPSALTAKDDVVVTAGLVAGNGTIKAELMKYKIDSLTATFASTTPGAVLSTVNKTFTVLDGIPGNMTFTIDALPTISGNDATSANTTWSQKVKVTAKDANGNVYNVPNSRIQSFDTSDTTVLRLGQDSTGDQLRVFAGTNPFQDVANTAESKTAIVTLTIGTDSGPKTVSSTVTISEVAKRAVQVYLIDTNPATSDTDLPTDYKLVNDASLALYPTTNFYIVYKDQYGIYNEVTSATFNVSNTDKTNIASVAYSAPKLAATLTTLNCVENSSLALVYQKDGQTATFTVRTGTTSVAAAVNADRILPTIVSRQTQDLNGNGQIDAIKVTFSEAIDDTFVTAANFAVAGHTVAFTATTNSDVADNNVIYLTIDEIGVNTAAVPTVTYTAGTLLDLAGNALATTLAVASTDAAAPVMMSVAQTAAATATVTMSEPVYHVALAWSTDWAGTVNAANTVMSAGASAGVLVGASASTVLITGLSPVNITTETVTYDFNAVGAAKIFDVTGNAVAGNPAALTDASGF